MDPQSFIFCVFGMMDFIIGWHCLTYVLYLPYKPQKPMTSVRTENAQQLAGSDLHSNNLFYLQNFGRKLYTHELGAGQSQCNAWDFAYFCMYFLWNLTRVLLRKGFTNCFTLLLLFEGLFSFIIQVACLWDFFLFFTTSCVNHCIKTFTMVQFRT